MHYIKNLRRGILVSPEDEPLLHWHLFHIKDSGYVCTRLANGKLMNIHKMILTEQCIVDHINLNKLDNRRENLRYATKSENNTNTKIRKDNSSGYVGVYKNGSSWSARLDKGGKVVYFETFITKEAAAYAYNAAALKHHGPFAKLNLIKEIK